MEGNNRPRLFLDRLPDGGFVLWRVTPMTPAWDRVVAEGHGRLRGRLVFWWWRVARRQRWAIPPPERPGLELLD
jgi:hypothetical protein